MLIRGRIPQNFIFCEIQIMCVRMQMNVKWIRTKCYTCLHYSQHRFLAVRIPSKDYTERKGIKGHLEWLIYVSLINSLLVSCRVTNTLAFSSAIIFWITIHSFSLAKCLQINLNSCNNAHNIVYGFCISANSYQNWRVVRNIVHYSLLKYRSD